jgi:hypothetical protein
VVQQSAGAEEGDLWPVVRHDRYDRALLRLGLHRPGHGSAAFHPYANVDSNLYANGDRHPHTNVDGYQYGHLDSNSHEHANGDCHRDTNAHSHFHADRHTDPHGNLHCHGDAYAHRYEHRHGHTDSNGDAIDIEFRSGMLTIFHLAYLVDHIQE